MRTYEAILQSSSSDLRSRPWCNGTPPPELDSDTVWIHPNVHRQPAVSHERSLNQGRRLFPEPASAHEARPGTAKEGSPLPQTFLGPSCRLHDRSANCHLQPRRTPRPDHALHHGPFASCLLSHRRCCSASRRASHRPIGPCFAHDLLRDRLHLARFHHRRGCPSAKTRRRGLRILRASLANYQEPLGFRSHGFAPCFSLPHTNMLTIDLSNASFDASSPSDDTSCYPSKWTSPILRSDRFGAPFQSRVFSAHEPSSGALLRVHSSMAASKPTTRLSSDSHLLGHSRVLGDLNDSSELFLS